MAPSSATGEGERTTASASTASNPPKRAWTTPALRKLGSVRELTLGGTMGIPEGGGTLMVVM